jgi:hypothetical protein
MRQINAPLKNGLQVAVVENGVVHLRKVPVVRDLGREVDVNVNSGVKQGDRIIFNPAVDLADGSKVRTRPQPLQTCCAATREANPKKLFNGAANLSPLCFSQAARRACPRRRCLDWP